MLTIRIGIDTYSFHRYLGELRPGEVAPERRLDDGGPAAIAVARTIGCDVVSLQTCFLGPVERVDASALIDAAEETELVLAWGAPNGLAFGTDPLASSDLLAWIDLASGLGCTLMRIVVGGPGLRGAEPVGAQIGRTIAPLRHCTAHAAARGVVLAVENHGDLTSSELEQLIERTATPGLGICFDTGNAARLREHVVEAAHRLAPHVRMVHLKDVTPELERPDPIAGPWSVPYGHGVVPLEDVLDVLSVPVAAGAPVCIEIGQVRPGDDERELVRDGVRWLRERKR